MTKAPTVKELRAECKSRGIKRYSKLKKAELLELLFRLAPDFHPPKV
jgi:hypothetical protein